MEGVAMTPEMVAAELDRIPPPTLAKLKRKLGMAGRDLASLTPEEQRRLVQLFRRGTTRPRDAPGPGTMPPAQQQAVPLPLPPVGQNNHQMYAPPPHAGPQMYPPIPQNGMLMLPGQLQGMQFNAPPMTPVHTNPMLGYGVAPPHVPVNPMLDPYEVTPAGMHLRQGMANPPIHQNMLQHMIPVGALPPPPLANYPLPLPAPHAAPNPNPNLNGSGRDMDLASLTAALSSRINTDKIRAAWLEGLSRR